MTFTIPRGRIMSLNPQRRLAIRKKVEQIFTRKRFNQSEMLSRASSAWYARAYRSARTSAAFAKWSTARTALKITRVRRRDWCLVGARTASRSSRLRRWTVIYYPWRSKNSNSGIDACHCWRITKIKKKMIQNYRLLINSKGQPSTVRFWSNWARSQQPRENLQLIDSMIKNKYWIKLMIIMRGETDLQLHRIAVVLNALQLSKVLLQVLIRNRRWAKGLRSN